jgi:hypothetical protein
MFVVLYSLGLGFALPVILIIVTNTVYFIIATRSIQRSPSIQRNNKDRLGFILYVKLFSLTGITWVLQIIDSVFTHSAFSFVVTVLIGCQGVFIFVSYNFNKRVYRILLLIGEFLCVCLSVCLSGYKFPQFSTDLLQVWRKTCNGSWHVPWAI